MQDLIRNIEKWYEKSAQEIADILNEKTIVIKNDDLFTYLGVRNIVGPVGAAILVTTMEQVAGQLENAPFGSDEWAAGIDLQQALKAFCSGKGIQLSLPQVQDQITQLSILGKWPDGLADSIKNIGIYTFSVCQKNGFGIATVEIVDEELKLMKFEQEKEAYIREQADRWNKFQTNLQNWNGDGDRPVL